jgi:hypothetical protein
MHCVMAMNRLFLTVIAIFRHLWRAFVLCFSYHVIDIVGYFYLLLSLYILCTFFVVVMGSSILFVLMPLSVCYSLNLHLFSHFAWLPNCAELSIRTKPKCGSVNVNSEEIAKFTAIS